MIIPGLQTGIWLALLPQLAVVVVIVTITEAVVVVAVW